LKVPTADIDWTPSFRIMVRNILQSIFSKNRGDPSDWEYLSELEKLTDPSLDVGDLANWNLKIEPANKVSRWILPCLHF